jgi:hypothetical protein
MRWRRGPFRRGSFASLASSVATSPSPLSLNSVVKVSRAASFQALAMGHHIGLPSRAPANAGRRQRLGIVFGEVIVSTPQGLRSLVPTSQREQYFCISGSSVRSSAEKVSPTAQM